jgi:peroxiredoxin Q/BCP
MNKIRINQKAPLFSLFDSNGKPAKLKDYNGKWKVLYFYPKDDTSGCTLEAKDFTRARIAFKNLGCEIIGVSPDGAKSHCDFINKYNLNLTLLSDERKRALASYGVWREKSLYGKKIQGVERTTFLIDPDNRIRHAWHKVNVPGHVNSVLYKLKELIRCQS